MAHPEITCWTAYDNTYIGVLMSGRRDPARPVPRAGGVMLLVRVQDTLDLASVVARGVITEAEVAGIHILPRCLSLPPPPRCVTSVQPPL